MFNVTCDGKAEDKHPCFNMVEGSSWYASEAKKLAKDEGWRRVDSKDYCPSCVSRKVWKLERRL